MKHLALLCLLLAGCASTWVHPSAGTAEFQMDSGQCQAQAYSAPPGTVKQLIYESCMQGKGWQKQ